MPVGWFDKIVLNDYNYGVYNFFKCCQDEPEALVKMIEKIGPYMSEELFKFFLNVRSRADVKPMASAAMTYWVTQASYNGRTDLEAPYSLSTLNNQDETFTRENEKEEIERIIKHAEKNIKMVHDRMLILNVIVENMDYRELIKKYNGKPYTDINNIEYEAIEKNQQYNKLWYFDPPYHPATLYGGQVASYEDTFSIGDAKDMVKILHGDHKDEYGELQYFIKSDYCPKTILKQVEKEYKEANKALPKAIRVGRDKDLKNYIIKLKNRINQVKPHEHDFDILEDNVKWDGHDAKKEPEFYRVFVGEFDKGSVDNENRTTVKGSEYIWCRGNYIEGMVSD